ncbi:MAG: erythromycin esterase family protein [Pseudobacter sp.]|uniref:erythromycin esterase family protein n=1 Tax=Pseudobacter sp. TaxID=2045420 RepID=UPI003F80538D
MYCNIKASPMPVPTFMKLLFFPLIACCFAQCKTGSNRVTGNSIAVVRSIDPADTEYADLAPLQKAIGNARVVMLGEQTHGEGGTFLARTRLIKFLHDKMDFDVLAFESGFYDVTRIWENTKKGGQLQSEVKGSLFYMYATSKQTQPLFDWLQSILPSNDPVTVTGFESQHSGAYSKSRMFEDFESFLKTFDANAIDSSWTVFKQLSVSTFSSRAYRPSEKEKQVFFGKLTTLKQSLSKYEKDPVTNLLKSPGFWYRVVASIESQALRYWEMVQGNEVSYRDKQMADNLIWLSEYAYPGKKIMVWAHNVHVAKQTGSLAFAPGNQAQQFFSTLTPMGTTVEKHFGKKMYTIGFTSSEGSYQDFNNNQFIAIPNPPAGSIEDRLNRTGHAYAFIDLRTGNGWWQQHQTGMLYDFMPATGKWPSVYDGLFFIRKNFPVDR